MNSAFATEQEMVRKFVKNSLYDIDIRYSEWNKWKELELDGLFGIPDVVIAYGKVSSSGQKFIRAYAFELKLRNWRRALVQAFRYSAFAHYSSVVLDKAHIQPALTNIYQFQRSNIGLLSIDPYGEIIWHNYPKFQKPYSVRLFKELNLTLEAKLFKSTNLH